MSHLLADGGGDALGRVAGNARVRTVHLVFKTHLDLGFTDFAGAVKARYFDDFFPRALALAAELREAGGPERFVWTTGSWLIYEYLEEADAAARRAMEAAIAAGDVRWHALPFTTHTELMDASLFRFGLGLSQTLDRRFGLATVAAKMTDVPGHTRAMVPLLAEAGVRFLHIGVNPASTAPDVPDLFTWRSPDGAAVTVMYHKDDYGLASAPLGADCALAFAHSGDNAGPQSRAQVLAAFAHMRAAFPSAAVQATDLNTAAVALLDQLGPLPEVTAELGDTWIHGAGTDPQKVAGFRALSRLRRAWEDAGTLDETRADHHAFSRALLCVPEHTWGMARAVLNDYRHYTREELPALRATEPCRRVETSWTEQRQYLHDAVAALQDPAQRTEAQAALDDLTPRRPSTDGYAPLDPAAEIETAQFTLRVDAAGAICALTERNTGRPRVSRGHRLGVFQYEIFSQAACEGYVQQYLKNWASTAPWAPISFVRPDFDPAGAIAHTRWEPALQAAWRRDDTDAARLLLELAMPDEPVACFGCPRAVMVELALPHDRPEIAVTLQWFDRAACRLPDAIWYGFTPDALNLGGWTLDKMGQPVSPYAVVPGGNLRLHAVQEGVRYAGPDGIFTLASPDAPLIAPGGPALHDFSPIPPLLHRGVAVNLWNNWWNTNFPYWSEDDGRFRFIVGLE